MVMTAERLAEIEADLAPFGYSGMHEADLPVFDAACELLDEVKRLLEALATARSDVFGEALDLVNLAGELGFAGVELQDRLLAKAKGA